MSPIAVVTAHRSIFLCQQLRSDSLTVTTADMPADSRLPPPPNPCPRHYNNSNVKVIWHQTASPPQTDGSIVFARWRQCGLPCHHIGAIWRIRVNSCFLRPGPSESTNQKGKWIGSALFLHSSRRCSVQTGCKPDTLSTWLSYLQRTCFTAIRPEKCKNSATL